MRFRATIDLKLRTFKNMRRRTSVVDRLLRIADSFADIAITTATDAEPLLKSYFDLGENYWMPSFKSYSGWIVRSANRSRQISDVIARMIVFCLLANFCNTLLADDLLKSDWTTSVRNGVTTVFHVSGTNDRNNPLRKQLTSPFSGEKLFLRLELVYEVESLDSSQEDDGEFLVLWMDESEGGDRSTHQGVPTFGIHVNPKTGQNEFMVRYSSSREVYSNVAVEGDRVYQLIGCASKSKPGKDSPFDRFDLWIDPKIISEDSPDATIESPQTIGTVNWVGISTGRKTESNDRIQVSDIGAYTSWEEVFGISHVPSNSQTTLAKLEDDAIRTVDFAVDVYPILRSKCFSCHSGDDPESGVRLDNFDDVLNRVTPHDSNSSRLAELITASDETRMPPIDSDFVLSSQEIDLLKVWIDEGPHWDESLLPTPRPQSTHWAFQPIHKPEVPSSDRNDQIRTPVDAFIHEKHSQLGLSFAEPASTETLLRRICLDLLGLPPEANLVPGLKSLQNELLEQSTEDSDRLIDKWIDQLLTTQQYGERWGRHWLDVARWAESNGHQHNRLRPHAWRYRDYVIDSFRNNKPYDLFLREQIAGDLLPDFGENQIATGFLAAARYSGNELDKEIQRNDILVEVVNTTASAFLGITLECAQCHTHKFDPVSIRDYYRFQAFFSQGQPGNLILNAPKPVVQRIVDLRWKVFDSVHHRLVESRRARDYPEPILVIPNSVFSGMDDRERRLFDELESEIDDLPQSWSWYSSKSGVAEPIVSPHTMRWPLARGRGHLDSIETHLLIRGDVKAKGPVVQPGWPAVFGQHQPLEQRLTRLELADWMTAPDNPLTARVWVNRIWQWHFGVGLVGSSSDFGTQGESPSHLELLDWLAWNLIDSGWDTNHIHRLILNSRTYRQSTQFTASHYDRDPDNRTLWRWPLHRLEAEAIRDSILAVCGMLDLSAGGPSIPTTEAESSHRRSMYLTQRRDDLPEQQMLFDSPDLVKSCSRRAVSTVPLQSLYLLNSDFMQRAATRFSRRVAQESSAPQQQARFALELAWGRSPTKAEVERAVEFLRDQELRELCLALLNTNEFVYIP